MKALKKSQNKDIKYTKALWKDLKNSEFAVTYLTDAVEENDIEGFLLAVRDVIEARGGMGKLATKVKSLHRVSLYKALSKNGNLLFSTMIEILNSLGIGLQPYLIKDKTFRKRSA